MFKMIWLFGRNMEKGEMQIKKTIIFGMMIILIMAAALSSCGGSSSSNPVITYSNGNIDTDEFNAAGTYPGMVITDADYGFSGSTSHLSNINAIALQIDGKIVAVGSAYNNGAMRCAIARYKADGTLDTTFGTGGIVSTSIGYSCWAKAVAIQSDGKIVIAGFTSDGNTPEHVRIALARYNTNGSLDSTGFNSGGVTPGTVITTITTGDGSDDRAHAIAIQSDGKIVLGGYSYDGSVKMLAVVRYKSNGVLDTTGFGSGGMFTWYSPSGDAIANAITIQPTDQKIILDGITEPTGMSQATILRLTPGGTLDPAFNTSGSIPGVAYTGVNGSYAYSVALQSDGKIVLAGNFWDWTKRSGLGDYDIFVARFTKNGVLDDTFNPSGSNPGTLNTVIGSSEDSAYAIAIQPYDQRIVIAGCSDVGGGIIEFALVRYSIYGELDTTFGTGGVVKTFVGTGTDSEALAIAVQSDGKIIAAGYSYESVTPSWQFAVVRYGF
jgi:uncharacterized delta-60 repeat protein